MRSLVRRLLRGGSNDAALAPPVRARHHEPSMLFSADDDPGIPSERLISLSLQAIERAREIRLARVSARIEPPLYPDIWPGEHYRLLAALVDVLRPRVVIEIGTATGLSALAMKEYLPQGSELVTFDVVPWQRYPGAVLRPDDFEDGRFRQEVQDLTDPAVVRAHTALLKRADFIFVDAAKDGAMESQFLANFRLIPFEKPPVLLFDDIRLWNMLKIWREIDLPKLDLTSFGHWSGTGLVEWR